MISDVAVEPKPGVLSISDLIRLLFCIKSCRQHADPHTESDGLGNHILVVFTSIMV